MTKKARPTVTNTYHHGSVFFFVVEAKDEGSSDGRSEGHATEEAAGDESAGVEALYAITA